MAYQPQQPRVSKVCYKDESQRDLVSRRIIFILLPVALALGISAVIGITAAATGTSNTIPNTIYVWIVGIALGLSIILGIIFYRGNSNIPICSTPMIVPQIKQTYNPTNTTAYYENPNP